MLVSSTPRKKINEEVSSQGGSSVPKKLRFDLLDCSVHNMSGIELPGDPVFDPNNVFAAQVGETPTGAFPLLEPNNNNNASNLVVAPDELFRFQLQQAFQEISDQINRVGTHLSQQISVLHQRLESHIFEHNRKARKWRNVSIQLQRHQHDELAGLIMHQPPSTSSSSDLATPVPAASRQNCYDLISSETPLPGSLSPSPTSSSRATTAILVRHEGRIHKSLHKLGSRNHHRCNICNTIFFCASGLAAHKLLKHNTARTFRCAFCVRRFRHRNLLLNHMRLEHDLADEEAARHEEENNKELKMIGGHRLRRTTILRPFVCGMCSKSFKTAESCDQHIRSTHQLRRL